MKQFTLTLWALLLTAVASWAQSARLQVIHNSPDPVVDVYVNGVITLNDFAFRTATPFIDVPAGVLLTLSVAPASSTSVADAIANFDVTLDAGKTYVVAASGIVGNATTPFTLYANGDARESAVAGNKVDISILHGAPDAPNVDIDAVLLANNVVTDLPYGTFTNYLSLDPGKYDFAIRAAGSPGVVASYRADLSGLAGQSATVFASGLLSGTPGFGLYAALADGTVIALPSTPTAQVQVFHNSPSPTVDVYAGNTLLINDFAYRTASPYVTVPADVAINVGVALPNSTSAADAIYTQSVNFAAGKAYTVVAGGIVGNATTPFTLFANEARVSALDTNFVDVNIFHGSTNAPAVDVDAVFVADNLTSNLAYGQFSSYVSVPPSVYDFAVRPTGNPSVLATYRANISGLKGKTATVIASGLLSGDPAFGLFAVLDNGTVLELPLTPTTRVQIVHNSPEPTVDVYAGNTLLLDNFAFRTATPFIDVPSDRDIAIGVALPNSTSANDAIATFNVNFATGTKYSVFASGIVGNASTPFTLTPVVNAQEAAVNGQNVDIAVLHGSPNAPAVDVDAIFVANNLISNLAYGSATSYLGLAPGVYDLAVRATGSPSAVATFRADLSGLTGGAGIVFASGLLGGNPGFGLYAVLPNGTVLALPLTPTTRVQIVHNSPNPTVDVYAGNTLLLNDFAFRTATPFIDVPSDRNIAIGVALPNSTSVNDVIATFNANFTTGTKYSVFASGIVGNASTPFTLTPVVNAQEAAVNGQNVDIAVLHGSPNAPAVDVDAVFVADNVVSNLAYGSYTPYLGLAPGIYDLAIRQAGNPSVVASFRADLSGLTGGAGIVFASGLLGGNPGFGLFAVLPNGAVIALPLTPTTRVQIIHNSPEPTVDIYAGNSLLLNDFAFRTATPFIDVPANRNITVGVAGANSTSASDAIATFDVNFLSGKNYTVFASGIVGNATTPFTLLVDDNARETSPVGLVGVSILHGSPDAPAVDVVERLAGPLANNLSYGDLTPYLSLPPNSYFIDVKLAGSNLIAGTFLADLSALSGSAVRVFASGLVFGTPGFGLFAALPNGTVIELPYFPVARVQIIHNSPEPTVDVYANGELFIDDFEFRTATEFIYLPAELPIDIGVAPGNSTSSNDIIATFPSTFDNGQTYIVVASGIVGGNPGFDLLVKDNARERSVDPSKIEVTVLHGAPGAPNVDVSSYPDGTAILPNFAYGTFTDYLSLDPEVLLLDVRASAPNSTSLGVWGSDLDGLQGVSGIIYASGLVNDDPAFDLYITLPDGFTVPLPVFTRAQVIHNSPAPEVDVYLDDVQVLDDFNYHDATGLGLLPARVPFTLSVAPGSSNSVDDAIYDLPVAGLDPSKVYVIMAAGVVGNATTPFQLYVNDKGRERALNPSNVELSLFHGGVDAPEVDVKLAAGPVIFDNIEFGEFADYLSVPPSDYVIQITPSNDNNTVVKTYLAELGATAGLAGTVYASGYLASTPAFETWVAFSDGTTFPLPEFVSTKEALGLNALQLSPNPATTQLNVRFENNSAQFLRYAVRDQLGRLVSEGDFGQAPAGENVQQLDVRTMNAGMYYLEILGENGSQTQKFVVVK
jgi:hypothetical protein